MIGFSNIGDFAFHAELSDVNKEEWIIMLDEQQTKLVSILKDRTEKDAFLDTLSQVNPTNVYALGVKHVSSLTIVKDDLHYVKIVGYINGNTQFPIKEKKCWVKNAIVTGFPQTGATPEMFKLCMELLSELDEKWKDSNEIPRFSMTVIKSLEYFIKKNVDKAGLSDIMTETSPRELMELLQTHHNILLSMV